MPVIIGVLLIIITIGIVSYQRYKKALRSIRYRIHVNGTRGKSTVVRLIAAGLQEGGLRVWGKTTGTKPVLIRENGEEEAIKRLGPPNI